MLVQQLVNGLMLGASYALVGVSFALILGVLDMLNLALGEVFMLGALVGLSLVRAGAGVVPALAGAMLAAGLVSLVVERLAFRPLRHTSPLVPLLSSIGFSMMLQDIAVNVWGSERLRMPAVIPDVTWQVGPVLVSSVQLVVLGTAVVLMVALQWIVAATRIGRGMRAVAESTEVASLLGVESSRVVATTFFVSGALAGAAGMLVGLTFQVVSPFMGMEIGLKGVAAMVVGGAGNVTGAMLAGPLLGIAEIVSVGYLSASYRDVVVYGLLIVILIVRPQGLLGTVQHTRV